MTDARFPERWLNDRRIMRLSPDAFRLFVVSLAWSVANRTDGQLGAVDVACLPGGAPSREDAQELVAAGLWDYERRPDERWQIVDYDETQTTSMDLAALDAARKKARDKKREQRAAAARRGSGSDVPGDVPRDSTRTGQDRTGSLLTEGQGLSGTASDVGAKSAAEPAGRERDARAKEVGISSSAEHAVRGVRVNPPVPSPQTGDGPIPVVPDDQHIPVNGSAGASVADRYAREDAATGHRFGTRPTTAKRREALARRAIDVIAAEPGILGQPLLATLGGNRQTAGVILNELADQGAIERKRDPEDGRKVRYYVAAS